MRFAGFVGIGLVVLLGGCVSDGTRSPDAAIRASNNEVLQALVDRYYACFARSAATGVSNPDRAAVAEYAFLACETEEHALFSHMAGRGWTYQSAFSIVNSHKMRLKQQLARV